MQKYPQVRQAINQLAGLISTEDMQKMNYQVDAQSRPIKEVVREWLKDKKL